MPEEELHYLLRGLIQAYREVGIIIFPDGSKILAIDKHIKDLEKRCSSNK